MSRALISGPASVARDAKRVAGDPGGPPGRAPGGPPEAKNCYICAIICPKTKENQSAFKRLSNLERRTFFRMPWGVLEEKRAVSMYLQQCV